MPSITVNRPVTLQEAADALQRQLGGQYTITVRHGGSREAIGVKRSLALAKVHLVRSGDSTTFRVHGSGLIINRVFNEFGIARKVITAISDAMRSTSNN